MSDFDKMLRDAVAMFNSWAPEYQARERRAQRRSWAIGELMLSHPEMTRKEAEYVVDIVLRD